MIFWISILYHILLQIISSNNESLRTVKLDIWAPQFDSNDQIIEGLSACPNLEKLYLRNGSFYINTNSLEPLAKLKKLTAIEFSEFEKITPQNFEQLFKQPQFKLLKKIVLRNCDGVDGAVIKAIADNCHDLNFFGVNQFKTAEINLIKSDDILYLAAKCKRIERLDLCYTHTSVGKALTKIVSQLPFLNKFVYCDCCNNDSKILLTSVFNILIRNLKNFSIKLECNETNFDKYLCGVREEAY